MHRGLADALLTDDGWRRLEAFAEVRDREPLREFVSERSRRLLADVDVLLTCWGCPEVTREVLALAPRLRLVAHAAGTVKACVSSAVFDRGIVVTSAAAAGAVPVAEFTVAAIVFAGKDVFRIRDEHRAARGTVRPNRVTDLSYGNRERRIGVVGASHVGRLTIERLRPFGFEVAVYDPFLDDAGAAALGVRRSELDGLLAWADVVSLHAPILPETHHMIGRRELALMRDRTWLINTARGWLVDEVALEDELVSGRLNALIDTTTPEPLPPESPLYGLPNVVLTPHIAGSQGNELARMSALAITEIERFAAGESPLYPVTLADLNRVA
jgi:phosphoglycerate dehydrogenase-like enzyme